MHLHTNIKVIVWSRSSGSQDSPVLTSYLKTLEIGKRETTYHWYVKRGCDTSKKILSGTSAASGLFGIKQTDYTCTFQNGTLCNAQIANYDTSLQIKFQTVGMLQCMQCLTPEDNTDKDRDRHSYALDDSEITLTRKK